MTKAHRCFLHLACIAVKLSKGRNARWHWDHLLTEFKPRNCRDGPLLEKVNVVPHH